MARNLVIFSLLLFLGSGFVCGEDVPEDVRQTWRIGIAEFDTTGLAPENLYVGSSYPLLIHEALARIDSHRFTSQEMDRYRSVLVSRELRRLAKERDSLLSERDAAYLAKRSATTPSSIDNLTRVTEALKTVSTLDQMIIAVMQEKPIEMVVGKDWVLLPRVVQDPSSYAEALGLDLLIYGLVEEIESYLFVDVYMFSAAFEEVSVFQTGFSREWLTESSKDIFDHLVTVALGRETGGLSVSVAPELAEIHVDGVFRGLGEVSLYFVEPGEHRIRITAYGFEEYNSVVSVQAGVTENVHAELVSEDRTGIGIVTIPAGADVYASSQWYGKTPMQAPPGMEHLQGLIRKEGYSDYLLPILPSGQDDVVIRLLPEIVDRQRLMKDKRNDFYRVFAAFVLSLPLPIYFFDATNTLTLSYLSEAVLQPASDRNRDEQERLFQLRQMSLSAYVGTVVISAALFGDAIVELLRFIDLANLSTY